MNVCVHDLSVTSIALAPKDFKPGESHPDDDEDDCEDDTPLGSVETLSELSETVT